MIDINKAIGELSWHRQPYGLYEPIAYALEGGGKRLRPTLAMVACRMYGGDEEKALPVALALEIFHNFTLLHDDVQKKEIMRLYVPEIPLHAAAGRIIFVNAHLMTVKEMFL